MSLNEHSRRHSDQPCGVLIIEDNPGDAELVKLWLTRKSEGDYEVSISFTLTQALTLLGERDFDAIILDLSLPDAQELEALEQIGQAHGHIPVVIMSGLSDESIAAKAVAFGAQDYLLKDEANAKKVKRALRYAIRRKDAELRLVYLAQYDQLTHMPNRASFFSALRTHVDESREQESYGPVVLVIDLDGFKEVNDRHGHAAGDDLLVEVAKRLTQCVRSHDLICRLGGDEFAIILNGAGSDAYVDQVIARVFKTFESPVPVARLSLSVPIGMCVGVASYPAGGAMR